MWTFDTRYSLTSKAFAEIYRFYVIESPVFGTSERGKTFRDRGIRIQELNRLMKKETPFLNDHWFVVKLPEVPEKIEDVGLLGKVDYSTECIVHIDSKSSKTVSLFYFVRCALAHGAFETRTHNGKKYYLLENKHNIKLKGRMLVKEESLLKWKSIVENSQKNG